MGIEGRRGRWGTPTMQAARWQQSQPKASASIHTPSPPRRRRRDATVLAGSWFNCPPAVPFRFFSVLSLRPGLWFEFLGLWLSVVRFGFKVVGLGFRVQGLGLRVEG